MSELAYLGLALAVSIAGSVVVWQRQRRPRSMDAGIEEFSRSMQALRPEASESSTSKFDLAKFEGEWDRSGT